MEKRRKKKGKGRKTGEIKNRGRAGGDGHHKFCRKPRGVVTCYMEYKSFLNVKCPTMWSRTGVKCPGGGGGGGGMIALGID